MQSREFAYHTCDVFTDTRFGGNPLAVVPDAEGLGTTEMQRIAREFNYSETTFIQPPELGYSHRLRIFTRQQELAFAGHPNIGSAFVLTSLDPGFTPGKQRTITFEQPAGPVEISVHHAADGGIRCELKAPASLSLGEPQAVDVVADALNLAPADIRIDIHPPREASVGKPFLVVEVVSLEALERARPNVDALMALDAAGFIASVMVYTRDAGEVDLRCRMFAPLGGTVEDPATGSAACALTGLLAHVDPVRDGALAWRMAQGVEMGRPSRLDVRASKAGGEVTGVWLAGTSVAVCRGVITV